MRSQWTASISIAGLPYNNTLSYQSANISTPKSFLSLELGGDLGYVLSGRGELPKLFHGHCLPVAILKASCKGKYGQKWLPSPRTSSQSEGYSTKWLIWLVYREPLYTQSYCGFIQAILYMWLLRGHISC